MKTIQVEVGQELIDRGVQKDCSECPVALGISRNTGRFVTVSRGLITFSRGNSFIGRVPTPASARAFIDDFDAGRPVSPFSFPLEVPEEVLA